MVQLCPNSNKLFKRSPSLLPAWPMHRFLQDFKVPKGEYLLSNAANSVLGRELIQMARRHGTKLINVVRRREVVDDLRKLGCALCCCFTCADAPCVKISTVCRTCFLVKPLVD